MLINKLMLLYQKLRLLTYKSIFFGVKERAGSLSATEAFSADTINILGCPTISEFADYIGISQPNATYKVNALVAKGYLEKVLSEDDRREIHLKVSEKFQNYMHQDKQYVFEALEKIKDRFSQSEIDTATKVIDALIGKINDEETVKRS